MHGAHDRGTNPAIDPDMSRTGRILVVDDDANARTAIAELLRDEGFDVEVAADAFKALGKYESFAPHVVLTNLVMPGMEGIELVKKLHTNEDACDIVVMATADNVELAVEAMRAGACDFLQKPLNFNVLRVVIDRVLDAAMLRREARQLKSRIRDRVAPGSIIGDAPLMQRVFETIEQVAPTKATVLLTGEAGTGKELLANTIHEKSGRTGPFIKLHCAALAEGMLESELFGHEKGAFEGATSRKDGRCSLADGGTLFLDEVSEVSPALQIKLLRFIQEHAFERVGGSQTLKVDVRVIVATNRNLKDEVAKGRFREDLFYRLNVVTVEVPALRERRNDIPTLARLFLERFAKDNGKPLEGITNDAMELLVSYDWPGNVRELENAIERAVVLAQGKTLESRALPPTIRPSAMPAGAPVIPGSAMSEIERYAILETLKSTRGSTSKAADILGISTRTIQYRLHEYNATGRSVAASANKEAPAKT
jgi:DNA-binding NtrC family response regulator